MFNVKKLAFGAALLAAEGMNSIAFGEIRGRGEKSTDCSEYISVMEFYLSREDSHLFQW